MPAKIAPEAELSKGDLWVFGYGSLMWRPGFEFIEQVPARLIGEHRALCVYSFDHRGTPEKPGLVLGLDRGGACRGVAFRIAEKHRADTLNADAFGRLVLQLLPKSLIRDRSSQRTRGAGASASATLVKFADPYDVLIWITCADGCCFADF